MTIRMGIIGVGDFGELHLKILADHPDVEIVWICKRTESDSSELIRKYGGKYTPSYKDVLKDKTVDAVSILTPENVHYEQVIAALEYSKDILVEKPVAIVPEHIQEMADKAKETNRIVFPAHICRFIPSYAKVKQYLTSGKKKIPVSIFARRNIPRERLDLHNRNHPAFVALSHDIDLILTYADSIPKRIFAMERKTCPDLKNPDIFWGMIEFENECIAVVETLWILPTNARYVDASMEIATNEEILHINFPGNNIWIDRRDGFVFPDISIIDYINKEWIGALKSEIDYFLNCVKNRRKPEIVTLEDAVMGANLAQQLILSAEGKGEIWLDKKK